jgi:RNA polymerase sigma-B factor
MTGELRRYFRDLTWAVRPPRALQELCLEAEGVRDELLQELGRVPSAHDVAARLDRDVDEVVEALVAGNAYTAQSLDAPIRAGDQEGGDAIEHVVDSRDELDRAEDAVILDQLCAPLREPDRELLSLRYRHDLLQREIGERVGCSQMHVSRRLHAALVQLQTLAEAG